MLPLWSNLYTIDPIPICIQFCIYYIYWLDTELPILANSIELKNLLYQFTINWLHKYLSLLHWNDKKLLFSQFYRYYMCVLKIENMIFSLIFFPTTWCTKGVVTFYLRLKIEFQAFPTKNLASNWLTCWLGQPIRGMVFGDEWLEFISQSQIKKETTYNFSNHKKNLHTSIQWIS